MDAYPYFTALLAFFTFLAFIGLIITLVILGHEKIASMVVKNLFKR
jgi:hypothetical protein